MQRIEAYFNNDKRGHEMSLNRMNAIMEIWRRDGRDVEAHAHEDKEPHSRIGLPRFHVIISPQRVKGRVRFMGSKAA